MKLTIAVHSIFYTLVFMIMTSTMTVEGLRCRNPALSQPVCTEGSNYPKAIIDKENNTFTCPGSSSPRCCNYDPAEDPPTISCTPKVN
ncbi:hypothetical protein PGT21_028068 [Puccinia graminis f. sp. tritici]|uniref:Uncharacterized protein n=1 Tax=Puccinia graminis f. sp. tritici TaxID=56615 RepID=A0A5B0QP75_PUCGR|nr:hypothetical protein PGT21_028068 [Puccinia graminis f. sp. tritici]